MFDARMAASAEEAVRLDRLKSSRELAAVKGGKLFFSS
jgi:hypothetical protein